jgi:anti-sigma factor RsiW
MSCERIEDLLVAYADGELEAADRTAVEGHLRICPDCAALLACLRTASASLAALPEIEPGTELRRDLLAIPFRKTAAQRALDLLRKPSWQPFYAAASILLALVSLYAINPDKSTIDKAVSRAFHRGYSKVERLYAEAGSVKDRLGDFAQNVYVSLEGISPFKRAGE